MSEVWSKWQGHVVNDTLPLRRYLGSSDHSGVFLTDFAGHEPTEVAIKLLRVMPHLVEPYRLQWEQAATLEHPRLIRLLETGQCQLEGQPYLYLVMEYADQTLAQLLEQRALAEDEAREMLLPVLDTLAFLHNKNLVQGQLKPANILVVGDELRLASDTIRGVSEATAGTNMVSVYDPPEIHDGTVSTAGDMWALGITLFEALTRSPPIGLDVRRESVGLPGQFSPLFRDIVGGCLSRRTFDRPKAAELAARLRGEGAAGLGPAVIASPSPTELSGTQRAASAPTGPVGTQRALTPPTESTGTHRAMAASAGSSGTHRALTPPSESTGTNRAMAASAGSTGTHRSAPTAPGLAGAHRALAAAPGSTGAQKALPEGHRQGMPPAAPSASALAAAAARLASGAQTGAAAARTGAAPPGAATRGDSSGTHRQVSTAAHVPTSSVQAGSAATPDPAKAQRPPPKPIVIEQFTPESLMPELAAQRAATNSGQPAASAPRTAALDASPPSGTAAKPSNGTSFHTPSPNTEASYTTWSEVAATTAALNATASDLTTSGPTIEDTEQQPALPRSLLPIALGAIVLLVLAVTTVYILRSRANTTPPPVESYQDAPLPTASDPPPASASDEPVALPVSASATATRPLNSAPRPATRPAPAATSAPAAPTSEIHEEIPEVPPRVLQTIHGHVRVSVRLIVDKEGTVFAALIDEPGPSRYFEHLAIEAAKKWTFPPLDTTGSRLELVRFEFTRQGATGRAIEIE